MNAKKAQARINAAATLGELCETLNVIMDELRETGETTIDQLVDVSGLPTFGGTDPENTCEVWSWDAKRVLVADGSRWSIENRCHCGEATFHCIYLNPWADGVPTCNPTMSCK